MHARANQFQVVEGLAAPTRADEPTELPSAASGAQGENGGAVRRQVWRGIQILAQRHEQVPSGGEGGETYKQFVEAIALAGPEQTAQRRGPPGETAQHPAKDWQREGQEVHGKTPVEGNARPGRRIASNQGRSRVGNITGVAVGVQARWT